MGDNKASSPKRRQVSPVKEVGRSSPRIRDGIQESTEIPDEPSVIRYSSLGSQHTHPPRRADSMTRARACARTRVAPEEPSRSHHLRRVVARCTRPVRLLTELP